MLETAGSVAFSSVGVSVVDWYEVLPPPSQPQMEIQTHDAVITIWVHNNNEELQKSIYINFDENPFSYRSQYYLYIGHSFNVLFKSFQQAALHNILPFRQL